jgi:hypothetical protein
MEPLDVLAGVSSAFAVCSAVLVTTHSLRAEKQASAFCCSRCRWSFLWLRDCDSGLRSHEPPLDQLGTDRSSSCTRIRNALTLAAASMAAVGIYLSTPLANDLHLAISRVCPPQPSAYMGKDPAGLGFSFSCEVLTNRDASDNAPNAFESGAVHEAQYQNDQRRSRLDLGEGGVHAGPEAFAGLYISYGTSTPYLAQTHLHHRYQTQFLAIGTLVRALISFLYRPRTGDLLTTGLAFTLPTILVSLMLSLLWHHTCSKAQCGGSASRKSFTIVSQEMFDNEEGVIFSATPEVACD